MTRLLETLLTVFIQPYSLNSKVNSICLKLKKKAGHEDISEQLQTMAKVMKVFKAWKKSSGTTLKFLFWPPYHTYLVTACCISV